MAVAMNDLHAVIMKAREGGKRTVTLGGHSLGGSLLVFCAVGDLVCSGGHLLRRGGKFRRPTGDALHTLLHARQEMTELHHHAIEDLGHLPHLIPALNGGFNREIPLSHLPKDVLEGPEGVADALHQQDAEEKP